MSMSASASGQSPIRMGHAAAALAATFLFLVLQMAAGLPTMSGQTADNDSFLRLVEVRDLIAGQGWFDLHQYRMGPAGGLLMHWSRFVDAPIALIVLAGQAATGSQASGETIALVLWPALMFFAALWLLLRCVQFLAGENALLPAMVIGAAALHYTGQFAAGVIDHHNVEIALTLGIAAFLLDPRRNFLCGAVAGSCAALVLAIAMEAVPYVAAAGAWLALWLALRPADARHVAASFGVAFAGGAALAFLATVPAQSWFAAQCDAFSAPQFVAAVMCGAGLAAIAAIPAALKRPAARLAALAALGFAVGAVVATFFPQCLGDPYAGLDPRMRAWWLDAVTEAQPLWRIAAVSPAMAAGHYAPPLLGCFLLAVALWRQGPRRETLLIAALLATALAVSVWQVRGSMFALPLAAAPLAVWVETRRRQASAMPGLIANASMIAAWLLSFSVVWSMAATALTPSKPTAGDVAAIDGNCTGQSDFGALAALPASTVLTVSNLGPAVLRYTPHRVLAGPYHRNVAGNLAAIDMLTGPPTQAEALAGSHGVGILALCRGNDETRVLAQAAPGGLIASLVAGQPPAWIVPLAGDGPLEIYRVAPAR